MATRYAVGITGSVSWTSANTAIWSTASGGAGGASVPTRTDDVIFDANSGTGTVTTTASATMPTRNLVCTGFAGTLSIGAGGNVTVFGPTLTLSTTMTLSGGGQLVADSTDNSITVTTNGKSIGCTNGFSVRGTTSGNSVLHADALSTVGGLTHVAGNWLTQNFALTGTTLFSNSGTTRSFFPGSSSITLTGTGAVLTITAGGLTWNANTATINITSGNFSTSTAGFSLNGTSLVITGGSSQMVLAAVTAANLTVNGTASRFGSLVLSGDVVVTGATALNGSSVTSRIAIQSSVPGTQRTLTTATLTAANADFADIIGAGAANWNLSAIPGNSGDMGGNSGMVLTPGAPQYRVNEGSATSLWSDVTKWASTSGGVGGSGRIPLPQDDAIFDNNSTALNLGAVVDMPRACRSIDMTGYTLSGSVSPLVRSSGGGGPTTIYGSFLQGQCVFNSSISQTITFSGRGNFVIQINNSVNTPPAISAPNGTYTLATALTMGGSAGFSLNDGTLDATGQTVTTNTFSTSSGRPRALIGGNWVITSTSATVVWSTSVAGLTITGTPNITISAASANTRTLSLNGFVYGTITYTVAASTGILAIGGSGSNFALSANGGKTIQLGSNSTFVVTGWSVGGVPGSLATLVSSTAGTQARLRNPTGAAFVADYLSVQDITGQDSTGTAAPSLWYVGGHSTNVSNNTGLTFSTALVLGQAIMSGSAQPVSAGRSTALHQATGASTAQPVSRTKQQAIGQATGASTAQPSHTAKARTLSVATGASIAQSAFRTKTRGLGAAAGASTGLSVAPSKAALLQAAVATSTGQPLRAVKQLVLTAAGETDIGLGAARIFLRDYELVLGDPLGDRLGFGVPTDRLAWAQADERPIFGQAGDRLVFGGSGV